MKKQLLMKTFLVAVCLLGGANFAWADDVVVPTPVYFNDFSSTAGLTQEGSGEFISDDDARFGQIYHNNPIKNKTARTNYLKLPADVLTHSGTSKAMTIGFWVNVKDAETDYFQCPVFSAYATSTPGNDNGIPMFRASAKGVMQLNNGDGNWSDFTKDENDDEGKKTSGNTESTVYLDDSKWHYYTITLAGQKGIIYVDGAIVNSWTLSSDAILSAFFTSAANGGYPIVCLGGNQSWGWPDWDASFGYDDFAIYDVALSAEQINQIISNKIHYTVNAVDGNSNVLKVLADANSSANSVSVTYPRYILDGTTLREAAATSSKYTQSFELTSGKQTETIAYTKSTVSNVYYYAEGEDVLTTSKTFENQSLSMNKIGSTTNSTTFVKITTLPAGTWTITARYFCGNKSGAHNAYIKIGSEVKWSQEYADGSSGNSEKTSGTFTLTQPTTMYVAADGANTTGFDWFYVSGTPSSTIIGAPDCSTDYLVNMSDKVTLAPGQSWHYKFVNHNMGSTAGMAQNWVLPVYASDGTTKKIVIRSDNWEDVKWDNIGFGWTTSSGNWYDNFVTEMDNATIDMTVNYSSSNVLTMSATITTNTDRTLTYTYNSSDAGISLSDNIKIATSVSRSWLELMESWPTATIGSTGWATFSSDYALDFSKATEGLEAYMITGHEGSVVTKSQVTGTVPAGTGLLLKGDAGNYNIPIVGSSSTDVSANKLVAGTGASVSAEEGKTKYVLGVNEGEAEFQKIVGTAATVAKGKAYLQFNEAIEARSMSFEGDEITGIENVAVPAEATLKEGKFIENGQLVIVKNGVKFNAAGQQMK